MGVRVDANVGHVDEVTQDEAVEQVTKEDLVEQVTQRGT